MKAKLAVLALAVALLGWVNWPIFLVADVSGSTKNSLADAVQLVPYEFGDFERTEPHWHIVRNDGAIEEGSIYRIKQNKVLEKELGALSANSKVQLDFYRAYNKKHNGLMCYIGQGETLRWTRHQSVQDPSLKINVVLGLTQLDRQLRLTAAAECYADSCDETPPETHWGVSFSPWAPLSKDKTVVESQGRGVVPMSVVMTSEFDDTNRAQVEHDLLARMDSFLSTFDFAKVKHLASLQ